VDICIYTELQLEIQCESALKFVMDARAPENSSIGYINNGTMIVLSDQIVSERLHFIT
jgi:hypothetical protein